MTPDPTPAAEPERPAGSGESKAPPAGGAATPPDPAPRPDRRAPPPPRRSVVTGVAAAVAGWVLPGLGHLLTGHTVRGLVLAVTLGSLWLGGLLIGGLSVVDRQADPAWFLGQALLAPSLAANHYRARLVTDYRAAHPNAPGGRLVPANHPPLEPSFGRARELGTLYTSLAGLLNLLAMLDVVYRPAPRTRAPRTAGGSGKAKGYPRQRDRRHHGPPRPPTAPGGDA